MERIEICVGSLPDDDVARTAVNGVDAVVHLASLLRVPWRDEFHTVNVGGTTIGRACAEVHEPPALIHISSLAALGPSVRNVVKSERDDQRQSQCMVRSNWPRSTLYYHLLVVSQQPSYDRQWSLEQGTLLLYRCSRRLNEAFTSCRRDAHSRCLLSMSMI